MDILTKKQRSQNMSLIKGTGNRTTEGEFIKVIREWGISGWRRRVKLEGKPDFVFPKIRLSVFLDGCFWHGCPSHATWPKNNAEFWRNKIERNIERDLEVNRSLKRKGWRVFRIWEHELKLRNRKRLLYRFRRIGLLE